MYNMQDWQSRRVRLTYQDQIDRLRDMELGDPLEPLMRFFSISTAGILIYIYTGWTLALVWAAYFLASSTLHARFISQLGDEVTQREVNIAAILFANLQISFALLPTYMFCSDNRALAVVGAALIAAQMVFQLRRSHTLPIYTAIQVGTLAAVSVAIFISFIPSYDRPLAYVGVALALAGMNFYFWQGVRSARRMRMRNQEETQKSLQSQKMAAIGQLAGGVAHDFNNNLTAIIGSLELVQATDDPEDHKLDVENALVAARQAATTVKQLLIYARMERQEVVMVCLHEVLAELEVLTQRLIPTAINFNISTTHTEELVCADRHQLIAALINLIVNAADAMPQGGRLELRTQAVDVEAATVLIDGAQLAPGRYVRLSVSDTGHGIPNDIMGKVLDPFFTTKPAAKGTGLGLSMVLGMSRELGGGLMIHSNAAGTRVDLFLPSARNDAPACGATGDGN